MLKNSTPASSHQSRRSPIACSDIARSSPSLNVSDQNRQYIPSETTHDCFPAPLVYDDDVNFDAGDTGEPETSIRDAEGEGEVGEIIEAAANVHILDDDQNTQNNAVEPSRGSEDFLGQELLELESKGEESYLSFASEQEVDDELEAAGEYAAKKLFEQLQGGHHGCSEEEHREKL